MNRYSTRGQKTTVVCAGASAAHVTGTGKLNNVEKQSVSLV